MRGAPRARARPPAPRPQARRLSPGEGQGQGQGPGGAHWASRALSLSSLPHSQSFPGSTAKCRGSSLCSESVRGITAATEERGALPGGPRAGGGRGPQQPPGRPGAGVPSPGGSLIKETEWGRTQTLCASRSVKTTGVKTAADSLKFVLFLVDFEEQLDSSCGLC